MKKSLTKTPLLLWLFFSPLSVHKKRKERKMRCRFSLKFLKIQSDEMDNFLKSKFFSGEKGILWKLLTHDSRTQLTSSNRPFFFFNYKPCPKGLDYYFIIQTAPVMKCRIAELGHMGTARNGESSSKWFEILESKWYNGLGWCWQPP